MAHCCASCQINASKICGGCKKVHYCCQSCQVKHWQSHKGECKKQQKRNMKKQTRKKKQKEQDKLGYSVKSGFLNSKAHTFNVQSPLYLQLNKIIIANWIRRSLQMKSLYKTHTTELADAIINHLVIPQYVLDQIMYFQNDKALLAIMKWKSAKCIDIKFLEYLELKAFGVLESKQAMSYYKVDIFFLVTFENGNTLKRDSQIIKVFNASKMNGQHDQATATDGCKWIFMSDILIPNVLDLRLLPVSYFIQCKLSHRSEWMLTHFCIISFSTPNTTSVGDLEAAFQKNMSLRGMSKIGNQQPVKYRAWNPFALKYEYVHTESYIATKDYWVFVANELYLLNRKIQKRRIGVDII